MAFYWNLQYELNGKTNNLSSYAENPNSAIPYIHTRLYNEYSEDELLKACEADTLRLTMQTQTHGKNVSDVINFLKRYPVICSLHGERVRMLQITGGHLTANAFWWASMYCNLKAKHTVEENNSTKKLYKLIEASDANSDLYHYGDKQRVKLALDRLVAGNEPPLYTQGFYYGLTRGL